MANILYMRTIIYSYTHAIFFSEVKEDILFLFIFFSNENNFLIKWFAFKKARTTQKLFGEKEPF